MIDIGGTTIKTPSSLDISIADIVDLRQNLSGNTNADIIALGKRTLKLKYSVLTATDLITLLNILKANFFMTVVYDGDPEQSTPKTVTCRVSERTQSIYTYRVTSKIYRDINFELIER